MFLNKFLLIAGGAAVAGTGTGAGVGIYYGTRDNSTDQKPGKSEAPSPDHARQQPDDSAVTSDPRQRESK